MDPMGICSFFDALLLVLGRGDNRENYDIHQSDFIKPVFQYISVPAA